jgi:filamentous hemagglutinin family protein
MGPYLFSGFSRRVIPVAAVAPGVLTRTVLFIRHLLLVAFVLHVSSSQALTASAITSDGTLGTTITQAGATFNITGGNRAGSNLFHSFGLFSVGIGDSANFLNNSGQATSNIIGRVTGGQTSNISGTIRTTNFGDANLFLINPAGWIFGPTAFLNIGGSFHVSTADYLKLADGAQFHANLARQSVLTSAAVSAFGFLNPNPAGISSRSFHQGGTPSERPNLQVPAGKAVSLLGGDITMEGDPRSNTSFPTILAPGGKIQLASVASPGEVPLDVQELNPSAFERLGQINLSREFIDVKGNRGGGSVVIRGGRFVMDQSALGDGFGIRRPGESEFTGRSPRIDIAVTADAVLTNRSTIQTHTLGLQHGGGDVQITADSVHVSQSSIITSAVGEKSGNASNIMLDVRELSLDGGTLLSETGAGNSPGNAGSILVTAEKATMTDSLITSNTFRSGNGGDILLKVGELRLDGVHIATGTFDQGPGGNVTINARDSVVISNESEVLTRTAPGTNDWSKGGPSGRILIQSPSLLITNRSIVGSPAESISVNASSGDVVLNAGALTITDSQINSSSQFAAAGVLGFGSTPPPGDITISATDVTLDNGSISTSVFGGNHPGGDITINARQVRLANGSFISSDSLSSGANAGNITVQASDTFRSAGSSITTKADSADGGSINLQVGKLVELSNSQITASVGTGTGSGGNIFIDPKFVALNRSQIIANAFGGPGGNVQIVANVFLASPDSVVTASSALSTPGTVNIQAPIVDFSGSLAPLPEDTFQATSLLRQSCPAKLSGGKLSSLVVGSREGLPWEPGVLMPSPLYRTDPPSTPAISQRERPDGLARSSRLLAWANRHSLTNQRCTK